MHNKVISNGVDICSRIDALFFHVFFLKLIDTIYIYSAENFKKINSEKLLARSTKNLKYQRVFENSDISKKLCIFQNQIHLFYLICKHFHVYSFLLQL